MGEAQQKKKNNTYGKQAPHILKIQIKNPLTKRQAIYTKRCLERLKVGQLSKTIDEQTMIQDETKREAFPLLHAIVSPAACSVQVLTFPFGEEH
jgi:hypothetical protein